MCVISRWVCTFMWNTSSQCILVVVRVIWVNLQFLTVFTAFPRFCLSSLFCVAVVNKFHNYPFVWSWSIKTKMKMLSSERKMWDKQTKSKSQSDDSTRFGQIDDKIQRRQREIRAPCFISVLKSAEFPEIFATFVE